MEANRNPIYQWLLDSIRGLFLFGTPHLGLQIAELKAMLDPDQGPWDQKMNLLNQLTEGSEFLTNQKEEMLHLWVNIERAVTVVSFYETEKTPTIRKVITT